MSQSKIMDKPINKKPFLKKPLHVSVLVLCVAVLLTGLYSMTRNAGYPKINAVQMEIAQVQLIEFTENIPADGEANPLKSIILAAVESGQIEEKYVEEGAIVQQGEPIIRLSNTDLRIELMNRQEALANEELRMTSLKKEMARNSGRIQQELAEAKWMEEAALSGYSKDSVLFEVKAISTANYEDSRRNALWQKEKRDFIQRNYSKELSGDSEELSQLLKNISIKRRNLQMAQENLDKMVICAPESGLLSRLNVEVGEYRNRGENLGTLESTDGFKISARIDEHYLPDVKQGNTAIFHLDGKEYQLVVHRIYPQVENGRFRADLLFKNELPPSLRSGQSVQLNINLSESKPALCIKKGPWMNYAAGNTVYVVSKDGKTAVKRQIKSGKRNSDNIEIVGGLSKGESVIISSYENFRDAEKILLNK
ncbi:MAG: efflux RND transporter periplasmic adaptor subunit [Bacteroidetes bacterium]|nr:efflux RND transporter periplasmic adaptor subunit [Bacteroidota bacterium]